jgi:hypothetical protein
MKKKKEKEEEENKDGKRGVSEENNFRFLRMRGCEGYVRYEGVEC